MAKNDGGFVDWYISTQSAKTQNNYINQDREDWSAFAQVALQSIMIDYSEFPIQEQARVSALVADAMMHELKNRFK
jgi:fructose/tagatose bisphosphate aldolase